MPRVYLNGDLVDPADAVVSVFDHGLVTGDGVFESVAIRNGRPFGLSRHLERLERSAGAIGLGLPPRGELAQAASLVAETMAGPSGKLRITVTGGPGPLGSARSGSSPTVIVACEESPAGPEFGSVSLAPWPKSERGALSGAKTISYAENVVALARARESGASEALFFNLAGNLCEGTGSNVFVGLEGRLVTPALSSGCLAGVTRGLVLEITDAVEADVTRDQLARADELFLTSTTRGVQPVELVDGTPLAHCPGPLTKAAAEAFAALVERGVD
ncbi:MAG TPA: aminotransferase class IV [Acidimicrobiales bacterium]|nr:aminotransferase class IV [Acidimicrobiales bacterium]